MYYTSQSPCMLLQLRNSTRNWRCCIKKSKITSREHKIEFLRHTGLEFQALQAKMPERPSVRPSGRQELSPLLIFWMHALFFSLFSQSLLKSTYKGNTKLGFLVLWFKS